MSIRHLFGHQGECQLGATSRCNETVVPGGIYAGYRWRHGLVLCNRISALGKHVAIPYGLHTGFHGFARTVIRHQSASSFARLEAAFVKKMYNK